MRKICIILSVIIIPFELSAYEGIIAQSGSCGATDADCHYDLYEDGHLAITGSGKMTDYNTTDNKAPWRNEISSVEIAGIKSIGQDSFRECNNLQEVNIPATVEEIGYRAFTMSENISKINFEENSNLKKIGNSAFNNLPKLYSINIPETVTQIDNNAFNLSGVKNLVLPDSVFADDSVGLSIRALSNIKAIYCSEASQKKCEEYFNSGTSFNGYVNGKATYISLKDKATLSIYTSDGDKFYANGKWYDSLSDMNKGNYNLKRIYTVNEAVKAAGKKNTFKIRYK